MIAFDDIALGYAVMDRDHADSLELWEAAKAAPAGALVAPFAAFANHLREHFAREEALMTEKGFFALHCHSGEHARVLEGIASVEAELAGGGEERARRYLRHQFPDWFHNHLATMDRVTAAFLANAP
ncbi:hemerythrin domain-containing protein [Azospirillum agricola]|uniref:hemerythrin domain-containing protein n=1 Tax=Azospirillum agricola TaxID=1720247 RepID=UPI000A0EEDDA|nr:hemerythrin domain-containing protein [Azospirillum agricola]SMH58138.1 hemerythrin [Azospirillum lipoferum]